MKTSTKKQSQKDQIAAQFIAVLNEALKADHTTVSALCDNRIPCNDALADHPDVTVMVENGVCNIGLLGLINGILSRVTGKTLAAHYDEHFRLTKFALLKPVKNK